MYDTYSRYIYEWLQNTLYTLLSDNSDTISSILEKLNNILTILQYCLYLGCFALLLWVGILLVRPHLFKT